MGHHYNYYVRGFTKGGLIHTQFQDIIFNIYVNTLTVHVCMPASHWSTFTVAGL